MSASKYRQLPQKRRAQLAEGGPLSSRKRGSSKVDTEWDAEILKRIYEYESGEAVMSSAADVFAQARCITQQ